jgi:hypothetical protein
MSDRIPSIARFVAIPLALAVAVTVTMASTANAQARVPTGLGNVFGNLQVTEPRGDFGKNTGNGFGLGAGLLLRIDPSAIINWRTEAGVVSYGRSTRRIPLAGTGGLVKLDLETSSNIFTLVTGPQLLGPTGVVMPYITALGGFSVFWTESSVEGSNNDDEPFASTTNSSDFTAAYGGAAGLYLRVYNGVRPVRLELGARLLRHDNVSYLNNDRVREAFENEREPVRIKGRADFLTYYVGVSVVSF